ncbi:MAG TPA: CHAD domain-containing protein [Geobacteraceae bacterium]|nr:CHAD domain-containing protein [Geobacteraceae bacterium]
MTAIPPTTHLWVAARLSLLRRGQEMFDCWEKVLQKFELDDIHDLRVASRRLREALMLYAPCFPSKPVSKLNSRIKKLTGMLGAIRNTDEALLFLESLPPILPDPATRAVSTLTDLLQSERTAEKNHLQSAMKQIDPASLRSRFEKICNRPAIFAISARDPFMKVADFLRDTLHEREASLLRFTAEAAHEENIAAQHRLRIAMKHFRYRLELASFFSPDRLNDLIREAKSYQELLGTMHDLDVFATMISERIASPDASAPLLAHIAARRHQLFEIFAVKTDKYPLTKLAADARSAL